MLSVSRDSGYRYKRIPTRNNSSYLANLRVAANLAGLPAIAAIKGK